MPSKSIILHHDLSTSKIDCDQGELSKILNWSNITFVGAIPDLEIFIVINDNCDDDSEKKIHPFFLKRKDLFMEELECISGDILFIASDENGDPIDVDEDRLIKIINN